ncbi:MAG: DUF364 domain-containing protein [Thiolinea sp.]
MSLQQDLLETLVPVVQQLELPPVTRLWLPPLQSRAVFCDEFGFVMLDSGAIGAFYVSLDDTLPQLWQQFPDPAQVRLPLELLLDRLLKTDLPSRALGLGAYNALSQHLMQQAGYQPAQRRHQAGVEATPASTIGMVGYFGPLVERLLAQGNRVRVLEKLPERIPEREQLEAVDTAAALADCTQVICTASTLVNGTLDDILQACREVPEFVLTGPSAGGLPDALFARGIHRVGATRFADPQRLLDTLNGGASWGKAGDKYDISPAEYPGLARLLEQAQHPPAHN